MVKSWSINTFVQRKLGGNWLKAKIVGISPSNRTLCLLYMDDSHVEDDVDFDDVRVVEADGKMSEVHSYSAPVFCHLKKGDIVERDIDGTWFEATVMEFEENERTLQLKYLDGAVENGVDIVEVRSHEEPHQVTQSTVSLSTGGSIEVENKIFGNRTDWLDNRKLLNPPLHPISLNTHLALVKLFKERPHYLLSISLDDDFSGYRRKQRRDRQVRRRSPSEDNRLWPTPVSWQMMSYPPPGEVKVFPDRRAVAEARRCTPESTFTADMFSPLAGHCDRCCKLTIYRCSRCGVSFFCSRECQRQEWFAGHIDRCLSTPFKPLFRTNEGAPQNRVHTGTAALASDDDRRVAVRYCSRYPEIPLQQRKKVKGGSDDHSSFADWCYDDDEKGSRSLDPPPSYEESMLESKDAYDDAQWLGATHLSSMSTSSVGSAKPYDERYYENKSTAGTMTGKRRGREGMSTAGKYRLMEDVEQFSKHDEDTAKNLSEALGKSVEDVRMVLKTLHGDAEKTLEWFLGGGGHLSASDDDKPPLVEDGAAYLALPEERSESKRETAEESYLLDMDAKTSLVTEAIDSDEFDDTKKRNKHPNRESFMIRDDTAACVAEEAMGRAKVMRGEVQSDPTVRIIFTGVLCIGGRRCHLTLYHMIIQSNDADNSKGRPQHCNGGLTMEFTPVDALVALKTEQTAYDECDTREVFVESPLQFLKVVVLEPDNDSEDIVDAELRYDMMINQPPSVFGSSSTSSTAPHKIMLSESESARLLHCSEDEYKNRTFDAAMGRTVVDLVCGNVKTVLANPFYGNSYGHYVILTYQIFAGQSPSRLLSQSIRAERVPVFEKGDLTASSLPASYGTQDKESVAESKDEFGGSTVIPFTSLADVGVIPAEVSEDSIDQLVEMMAIDRNSAEAALRMHKGDINGAVDWIIGGMYPT